MSGTLLTLSKRIRFWATVPSSFLRAYFGWRRHFSTSRRTDARLAWRDAIGADAPEFDDDGCDFQWTDWMGTNHCHRPKGHAGLCFDALNMRNPGDS